MKKVIRFILFVMSVVSSFQGFSQGQVISGRVTGANDSRPIPGVNVLVKGTTQGTLTDADGKYSLQALSQSTLVFSFIGYTTQEVAIGSRNTIDIQLVEDIRNLDEVVVTAFGVEQEKKALSYSVQEVQAREITESQQPNIVNALQGKVAGVQVTSAGGAPGASSIILIRGGTSLSGNNQPLFVVDGIPIDNNTAVGQGTNLTAQSASASNRAIDINPEDIESLTVLKGPAATTLYGLRAAGGAVVITTKRGTSGAAKINYSNSFSFDRVNKLPELQNTYKQGEDGVFDPEATGSWGPQFGAGEPVYDNLGDFFKTSFTQKHDISVTGGTDKTSFYASASRFDQKGIIDFTKFVRNSVRLSADTRIGEKLRVGGSANYINSSRRYVLQGQGVTETNVIGAAGGGGTMLGVIYWPRNDDMSNYLNPDGTQRTIIGNDNPYWGVRNNPLTNDVNRLITVGNIIYDPFSFLNITYRLGTDYYTDEFTSVRASGTTIDGEARGAISQTLNPRQITTSTLLVTGKYSLADKLNFSLTLGHNVESARSRATTWYGRNFIDPDFPSINNTVETDRTVSQSITRRRIVGVFGDFNVDYKNILYLSVRGRNDWSSTLPLNDRSFFYPSISGNLIVTDLLNELGLTSGTGLVSFGKIRASWARAGKDAPAHVLATTLFTVTNSFTIAPRGFISNVESFFGNPELKPEFTNSFEIGADVRFFGGRIGIDATYYKMNTDNQILLTRTPPSTSTFLAYVNGGRIDNEGVELVLNTTPVKTTDFTWDLSVNLSRNTSIVRDLPGALDRVELSDASVAGSVAQGAAFLGGSLFGINGNVWKRNAQGQLLLSNNGYPQVAPLLTSIGDRNPDWLGGITNTLSYKGLSLSFLWDIRQGGDIYNATENFLVRSGQSTKTLNRGQTTVFEGIIESSGEPNTTPVVLDQNYYQTIYPSNGYDFVEDGGWVRLRYVTLSYSLPKSIFAKTPVDNLQIFATGRNLILITDYSGVDPEVSSAGGGVGGSGSFGLDNMGVPATRGFDIGLKLTL